MYVVEFIFARELYITEQIAIVWYWARFQQNSSQTEPYL